MTTTREDCSEERAFTGGQQQQKIVLRAEKLTDQSLEQQTFNVQIVAGGYYCCCC